MRRFAFALALLALTPAVSFAQQNVQADLRASQAKLDSIKNERARLQREMESLRTRVRDTSRELLNIERQREASRSALSELEFQTQLMQENYDATTQAHAQTRLRLSQRTSDLNERLRAIYKRGPMHATRVFLTARSFGDLLARYKYISLMALYDRMVVRDVARLERELASQEAELRESMRRIDLLRDEKTSEVDQLERVERQRQNALQQLGQQEARTATRITELEREQQRLTNTLADLERRRREEESRGAAPVQPATITNTDAGTLPWPVDGNVVYRFGPDQKPSGVVLKNNGIGIAAPAGTGVRAVEAGVVELAGPFPGYGLTVIISHGGGYRTLYLYLKSVAVREGQQVTAGTAIGTVGGEQTPEGAHIEFQVRVPRQGGTEPVDPLTWLRARRNP
jgi:septal ring factor EnvC (AmiA/AmiB activator)